MAARGTSGPTTTGQAGIAGHIPPSASVCGQRVPLSGDSDNRYRHSRHLLGARLASVEESELVRFVGSAVIAAAVVVVASAVPARADCAPFHDTFTR
jgi:hypothetical protein